MYLIFMLNFEWGTWLDSQPLSAGSLVGNFVGQQIRRSEPPRLVLEVDVGERLTVAILHDETRPSVSSTDHGGGKRRGIGSGAEYPQRYSCSF